MRKVFIFDLDGTITSVETLPLIASHFGVADRIKELTDATVKGNIPFVESFIKRVGILGKLPISQVDSLLGEVPVYEKLNEFLKEHAARCVIATGNLSCWVDRLAKRIGCTFFSSEAEVKDDQVIRLERILKKETVVRFFKESGNKVIFVGNGNNDVEAMREADVSIACGLTHAPARSVLSVADYLVYHEEALCRQLNQLC